MAGKSLVTTLVLNGKLSPSLTKAFNSASKQAQTTNKSFSKIGVAAAKGAAVIGTAIVGAGTIAVKSAVAYEKTVAKVATIADTSKKSIAQLSGEVLKLSDKTGVAAGEINEAFYQSISAGVDTANATKFVDVAIRAAKGGYTDTVTAVDGLTSVLNAYGLQASKSESIANQMFITQNLGKTTFGELASVVGKLAPITKAANVSTNEMFASLASLTSNGIQTSEAVSGMKSAISNIIKPTAEAEKIAQKLGLEFSAASLQSKGLSGFLGELKTKTGGNLDTMSKLFGSVEGLNTVLALTSNGGMGLLNKALTEMSTNSTALQTGFEKATNTPAERFEKITNKVNNLKIKIGEALLPTVEKITEKILQIDFSQIATQVTSIISFFTNNGGIIIGIIGGITAAIVLWQIAQIAMNIAAMSNPYIAIAALIIGVIALIIGGIALLWNNCEGFRNAITGFVTGVVDGVVGAWNWICGIIGGAASWIYNTLILPIGSFFSGLWTGVVNGFIGMVNFIIDGINLWLKGLLFPFNLVIGGLNLIPGVDIPELKLEIPKIPALAIGATVDRATLAMIGEAGTETVVPHNNKPRSRALLSEAAKGVGVPLGEQNNIIFDTDKLSKIMEISKKNKEIPNPPKGGGGPFEEQNNIIFDVDKLSKIMEISQKNKEITAFADGGTVYNSTYAMIGEAGTETVVPHNNKPRSRALLADAAKGVGSSVGNTEINFHFSPIINSSGEIKETLSDAEREFEDRMEEFLRRKGVLSFV